MHTLLLENKGLAIERVSHLATFLPSLLLALLSLSLSVGMAIRGSEWLLTSNPFEEAISWPPFLALLLSILLFWSAIVFSFFAYAGSSIGYRVGACGLSLRWGPLRYFVPIDNIQEVVSGRREWKPRLLGGLHWRGHHLGIAEVPGIGRVLFLSTHRSLEEVTYVRAPNITYAISPRDNLRFAHEVKRHQQSSGSDFDRIEGCQPFFTNPLVGDRIAISFTTIALLLNVGLFGYVFAISPGLADQIVISFPPVGEIVSLSSKMDIVKIPGTALAILAVNLLVSFVLGWRERMVAYLLTAGSVFLQIIFWVAIAIAIANT